RTYSVLLAEEALCSSAKRQDYEVFRASRQACFLVWLHLTKKLLTSTVHLNALFCKGANYSKALPISARPFFELLSSPFMYMAGMHQ
ncbi:hypothetical protein, partial [Duganella sp. S19_KUP01_CR8]|uniref:hypothetical protein n=1 Tax=Duganella sp. S19_KUP01_CR8 TaxID=3025502 RepID=UPI002FCD9012